MSDPMRPWRQYLCRACGLIYDEEQGDPDSGLAPGTRFEEIPDDWECPLCGVTKSDFELYEKRTPVMAGAVPAGPAGIGVVVVGAGLAGWAVVEALRALDADVPISLVAACRADVYHKPELSLALGRQLTLDDLVRERAAEAAGRLGVRLLRETHAIGLDSVAHRLRTTRGTLPYTHLVLAQGARPALPAELPAALCWRVNDLLGWNALQQQLAERPQRVAVIGAGMVGCELAEDLVQAGHQVTLIDRNALPLAALLPAPAARRLRRAQERLGIGFLGEAQVAALESLQGGARLIRTRCGQELVVDQVVAATGLATEPRLARLGGLAFERGIRVEPATLRTSVADVFALGDCISLDGAPCRFVEPIPQQAQVIARAVLGLGGEPYAHRPPVIRLKTRSLPVVLHGTPDADSHWTLLHEDEHGLLMEQRGADGQVAATLRVGKSAA